ncbi:hypothetical protein B0J18DRAFT_13743 [Chaetomium sp. MPI-SDFR-AT-0129]|uniref:DUF7492 domain-containing protein n=1 Tax=Dichotomopilus funicola TaxID=1934379 RepID=A0AAN6VAB5_9PEZI|nr:hypothetical protein B0J18DRAFT_13743 [Chaetomium sp. MPI-SDFR-AT-0129]KAK4147753.1 hypothetical protein C8A04DRAFT_24302 [Dichotomopilus funicola]
MKVFPDRTVAGWLLAALAGTAIAHSWPESTVRLAPDGKEVGKPGTERNHPSDSYILPPNGQALSPNDKIVRDPQAKLTDASYTTENPMLSVAPGDFVAIKYRENGHVSRPDKTDPGRPINRGTVYLYGTTENDLSNVNLMDVHLKWTSDGKGGNGKGKLLATRNYDDGQCHEAPPSDGDLEGIVAYRTKKFSTPQILLCQNDVMIPQDAPVGKVYTVIWVWDWPLMKEVGVAVPPADYKSDAVASVQLYTGVVDYKIVDPCDESLGDTKGPTCKTSKVETNANFAVDAPAESRGIASQMAEPFLVKVPQAGFGVAAATADTKHIPFANLIGQKNLQFPLAQSILDAQNFPGGGKIPMPTPGPGGAGGNASAGDDSGDVVVTVTSTIPEGMTTMTVTRGAAEATKTAPPKLVRALRARRHVHQF